MKRTLFLTVAFVQQPNSSSPIQATFRSFSWQALPAGVGGVQDKNPIVWQDGAGHPTPVFHQTLG